MRLILEPSRTLHVGQCIARRGSSQRPHWHQSGAFTANRPRLSDRRIERLRFGQIVAASPLNEGSTDADVEAVKAAGAWLSMMSR